MGQKHYSQSAGWMREIWALAIFVAGFTLYDWREGGENERILALLLMFGSGIFMCFAMVERMFFIPRMRGRQDPADEVEMAALGDVARNESVNYDGPRTAPRSITGASGGGASQAGPDGLDPVPTQRHFYPDAPEMAADSGANAETAAEAEMEAEAEADSEDDHAARAELESALSDPFFADDGKK